jgi:hypothetical protein
VAGAELFNNYEKKEKKKSKKKKKKKKKKKRRKKKGKKKQTKHTDSLLRRPRISVTTSMNSPGGDVSMKLVQISTSSCAVGSAIFLFCRSVFVCQGERDKTILLLCL